MLEQQIAAFPCSGEINFRVENAEASVRRVIQRFSIPNPHIDLTDGASADFGAWRFNLRSSNTEPLLRLNVESRADEPLMKRKTEEIRLVSAS
jgi:phosphomannomutase/phosphoglucomutase